ncbi:MAG: sigma-70 family RNA polymerase sigma factor [Oscillospiraceae bacterium]|nr:sigma-70 family RNA polymerase sigma factor [Oscillospiraceae bacterium]
MALITPEQVARAKAGDERALAGIISRMMPQIQFGAQSLHAAGMEKEDLVQEGLIGLMQAVGSFAPGKGAQFETYTASCIRNAQFSAVRAAQRKKHGPLNTSVPLSEEQATPGPEEFAIQQEELELWHQRFRSRLSVRERQAMTLFMDGLSTQQIADVLGCSRKAVESALARARSKLRSFL